MDDENEETVAKGSSGYCLHHFFGGVRESCQAGRNRPGERVTLISASVRRKGVPPVLQSRALISPASRARERAGSGEKRTDDNGRPDSFARK